MRFERRSHENAWEIVDRILDRVENNELQIQRELVELQHLIPETEAGKTLRYTLQQLLEVQKEMAEKLAARARDAEGGDTHLREKLEDTRAQIGRTLTQVQELKIPLSRRIKNFFGIHVRDLFLIVQS